MKRLSLIIGLLVLSCLMCGTTWADCRGCCSSHGGVVCADGVTRCADGTPLSKKCQAKDCNKCGLSTSSSSASPEPVPMPPKGKRGIPGNSVNDSFSKAKKLLQRQVYADHTITFYCDCPFQGKKLMPCEKYTAKRPGKRASRIEWEHVVPASHFGQSLPEWRNGHPDCVQRDGDHFKGRNCARKINLRFRYMEADMYNLVPAIGEINGLRSNYRYDMVAGEDREFGPCDFEIESRVAEPPKRVWGDIARTYKYMEAAYPGQGVMSRANEKLYEAWDKQDPVDAWECERCKRIEAIQGNENPFVKKPCQAAGMW